MLVLIAAATIAAAGAHVDDGRPDVFLLAGQSNMSGRGSLADLTADERTPDAGISLFGNDEQMRPALDPLDSPAGQVDAVSADPTAAVGPGLFFARAVRARRERRIVLVPCAKGGTVIAQWARSTSRASLYGSCLARAKAVGHVTGMLWYQGESDAENPANAATWGRAFAAFRSDVRRDLGAPRLPIVAVILPDRPEPDPEPAKYAGLTTIQKQQAAIRDRCTIAVPAGPAHFNPDGLHLDTADQRALGGRLADAMLRLLPRCGGG